MIIRLQCLRGAKPEELLDAEWKEEEGWKPFMIILVMILIILFLLLMTTMIMIPMQATVLSAREFLQCLLCPLSTENSFPQVRR